MSMTAIIMEESREYNSFNLMGCNLILFKYFKYYSSRSWFNTWTLFWTNNLNNFWIYNFYPLSFCIS